MNIAVLGCGPAGLIAVHAAEQLGHNVEILSVPQKSYIPGSQYLHEGIPGVTPHYPDYTVEYIRLGTRQGYANKVYGDPERACGWDAYRGLYPSWSVYNAYDTLWERYEHRITPMSVLAGDVPAIIDTYDIVITTIPQPKLCQDVEHWFDGVPYFIVPLDLPPEEHGREIVVYNGLPGDEWYRWSILGGRCSIESTMPMEGAIEGRKAVSNNCDCWPETLRVGRWAKWQHGVLLHNVYHDVANELWKG